MKKLLLLLLFLAFSCSTNDTIKTEIVEDTTTFAKGKPTIPKKKSLVIAPTIINTNAVGRIMEQPVDYTGTLPVDDNGGLVDWDNDGNVNDLVIITSNGVSVLLNGTNEFTINYSIRRGAILLGFIDVDNDGDMDIITKGGNPNCYDGVIGDLSDTDRPSSTYNVGYNVVGQYPLPTGDILNSMVVREVEKGKINNIKWDLSTFGYECNVFSIDLWEGDGLFPGTKYFGNWPGYGEWGFYNSDGFKKNTVYTLRFRYEDNGEHVYVHFSI